jgi:hypothetical protein
MASACGSSITGSAFKSAAHFYGVAFHEMGHWTGGKKRLDRDLRSRFGERAYAAEELIAELCAAFLCAEFSLDGDMRHALGSACSRRTAAHSSRHAARRRPRPITFAGWRCAISNRRRQREGKMGTPRPQGPLYDVDWINDRTIEVFYADEDLAREFAGSVGWYWWECYPGCLPLSDAFGPFPTSYHAYHYALTSVS